MSKHMVLYQIRSLEKMVIRLFLRDKDFDSKEYESREMHSVPTPTQMQIIEYILDHSEEDIFQKNLEIVLKLRRATVSGVLKTMEKNELIKRITYSEDSRNKKIILNDKAKKIFEGTKKKMEALEEIVIKDIPSKDLEIFSNVIEKMKINIDNVPEKLVQKKG